jgi:hypothetical protein
MFAVLDTLILTRLQPTLGVAMPRSFGVLYGANPFTAFRGIQRLYIASPRGRVTPKACFQHDEARRPAALIPRQMG